MHVHVNNTQHVCYELLQKSPHGNGKLGSNVHIEKTFFFIRKQINHGKKPLLQFGQLAFESILRQKLISIQITSIPDDDRFLT